MALEVKPAESKGLLYIGNYGAEICSTFITIGVGGVEIISRHDPATRNWFLVGSPLPTLGIVIVYTYFCTEFGPNFMKNRKPYNLKNCIATYNLFQVLVNSYMSYEGAIYLFSGQFNFTCHNMDDPTTTRAKKAFAVGYVFYMMKYVDLLDTVFFVLRKSNRQITSLHLHHHIVMCLGSWITITYAPGGPAAIVVSLNSLVHSIMYTYYFLSGLGEEYKKYLWWKKYVTTLQLIQFSIYVTHNMFSLFYDCGYPIIMKVFVTIYSLIFLYMFGNFYYNAYIDNNVQIELSNTESNRKKSLNKKLKS